MNIIQKEIESHFRIYDKEIDKQFLKNAYDYLSPKDFVEGIEYRFLCWLNHIYKYPIKLNPPFIQSPEFLQLEIFKSKYLFSDRREAIFSTLEQFILERKEKYKLNSIIVNIGGSFTDLNKENPNDIDCAILVPTDLYNKDYDDLEETYLYAIREIPQGLDIKFFQDDYNLNKFKAYSNIVCLGNKAQYTDGKLIPIKNKFKSIPIKQIIIG
ncbi:DUF6932 family protein [Pontibacter indicus]|uniref:Nucleotidyltransferase domain-containing protein n=1 Tax=Pontibacter indicus TaxID=1317125 RepID=A0A1R3WYM0_9BACT|nr:hypothetical protein [Pontibacter indicus]SIT83592.1 hypothetical protein SAMN05444128_1285 [Pontibacter indicus]